MGLCWGTGSTFSKGSLRLCQRRANYRAWDFNYSEIKSFYITAPKIKERTEKSQWSWLKEEGKKGSKRETNTEAGKRTHLVTGSELEHLVSDLLSVVHIHI